MIEAITMPPCRRSPDDLRPTLRMRSYRVPDEEASEDIATLTRDPQEPGPANGDTPLGRVAQLARARRLQRRGHRFEPCHAHQPNPQVMACAAVVYPNWMILATDGTSELSTATA